MYRYGEEFFDYLSEGSARSARRVIPLLRAVFKVESVLDVGCGRGAWLREWSNERITDFMGVDGDYIDDANLLFPIDHFVRCDIAQPFALGRRFELIQSLEVAEHIAESQSDTFVRNLAAHGDIILFSAAVPGQGGEFHVNEQPYTYWRDKFAAEGFRTFDWLRPIIRTERAIEPWYRYNTLIFVRESGLARVPSEVLKTEILPHQAIPTYSSLFWRLRNFILSRLPRSHVHGLAVLWHKLVLMGRR